MSDKFKLKWNDFQPHVATSFKSLRNEQKFADVTLMSNDFYKISAHKVVLASCSDYFRKVLEQSNNSQPLLCLDGINKEELINVVDYIYHGEVQIHQEDLDRFLGIAKKFHLQGLLQTKEYNFHVKDELLAGNIYENEEIESKHVLSSIYDDNQKNPPPVLLSDQFNSIEELNARIDENIIQTKGMKFCNLCTYQSRHLSHIREHVEIHFQLSFSCKICGKPSKTRNSLRQHQMKCQLKSQSISN